MARRWLPALAQREFASATPRKGMRIGFFSAHNYEIDAIKALASNAGIIKDNELVYVNNQRGERHTVAQRLMYCFAPLQFLLESTYAADHAAGRELRGRLHLR